MTLAAPIRDEHLVPVVAAPTRRAMPHAMNIRPEIRYAWRGPSMLVVDQTGAAGDVPLGGYYYHETRHLSRLALEVAGARPWLCAVASPAPNAIEYVFAFPGEKDPDPEGQRVVSGITGAPLDDAETLEAVRYRAVDLRLRYRVRPSWLEAEVELANRSRRTIELALAWVVGADYADFEEAWERRREQRAPVETRPEPGGVRFRYRHDELPMETVVGVSGGGGAWRYDDGRLHAALVLSPRETGRIVLRVDPIDPAYPLPEEEARRREDRLERWHRFVARVESTHGMGLLHEIVNANMHDLGAAALLQGAEEEWLAPAAGFPRFPALFARDALTAGWQAAVLDRGELLDASLTAVGRLQGTTMAAVRDEQPGRTIQQSRDGPVSRLGIQPFERYYGDQASPLMYLISIGNLYAWTGEKRSIVRHWDAARRIMDWARDYGDADGDGYIEYETRSPKGPRNQGWKDSNVAVVDERGEQVRAPIAASEIQGYWYAAQQIMAVLSWVMGDRDGARDHWRAAGALKERFNRDFWWDEESTVAFGLDAEKRQIRSVVSNAGHCLTAGIVSDERVPRLVGRLFAPDMFSGWGIRTLSTAHPSYNPISYHLGSVWPVENATIAFGLRRFGFPVRANEIARALFDLARLSDGWRVPETVGGYARGAAEIPGAFPRANAPQLWNGSAYPLLVQTMLGMRPVGALHLLAIDPLLPTWLPELVLRDLRVGAATVSLRFQRREDGRTDVETLSQRGTLRIVRQPPMDALHVGLWDRLGALIETVVPSWAEPAVAAVTG